MAAVKGRKHRVGVSDYVRLVADVPPETKALVNATAQALGISVSAYLAVLLARQELDEQGRPAWWDLPVPRDQEVLLLTQSA